MCYPVLPIISTPYREDAVIEPLRVQLQTLTWLDSVLPRAYQIQQRLPDGDVESLPAIPLQKFQAGTNDYLPVTPTDKGNFCFFWLRGKRNNEAGYTNYDLSLIVYCNLRKISNTQRDIRVLLQRDVLAVAQDISTGRPFWLDKEPEIYDTSFADVWAITGNTEAKNIDYQYDTFPFYTFRIDFSALSDDCYAPIAYINNNC